MEQSGITADDSAEQVFTLRRLSNFLSWQCSAGALYRQRQAEEAFTHVFTLARAPMAVIERMNQSRRIAKLTARSCPARSRRTASENKKDPLMISRDISRYHRHDLLHGTARLPGNFSLSGFTPARSMSGNCPARSCGVPPGFFLFEMTSSLTVY